MTWIVLGRFGAEGRVGQRVPGVGRRVPPCSSWDVTKRRAPSCTHPALCHLVPRLPAEPKSLPGQGGDTAEGDSAGMQGGGGGCFNPEPLLSHGASEPALLSPLLSLLLSPPLTQELHCFGLIFSVYVFWFVLSPLKQPESLPLRHTRYTES